MEFSAAGLAARDCGRRMTCVEGAPTTISRSSARDPRSQNHEEGRIARFPLPQQRQILKLLPGKDGSEVGGVREQESLFSLHLKGLADVSELHVDVNARCLANLHRYPTADRPSEAGMLNAHFVGTHR